MHFYAIGSESITVLCDRDVTLRGWLMANSMSCFKQPVNALCYLHDKNILHNDIKSDNVLVVSESGDAGHSPVLIDSGKAKMFSEVKCKKLSSEEKKVYREKHRHIAPEVIEGTHPLCIYSDVFSLGRLVKFVSKDLELPGLRFVYNNNNDNNNNNNNNNNGLHWS